MYRGEKTNYSKQREAFTRISMFNKMRFCENNSECTGQNPNPSICPNVLHIVNQWGLFNWWRYILCITEDWQKDQKGFQPGQWAHAYNSRHQVCQECSLVLRPAGCEQPIMVLKKLKLPRPSQQCECIQAACWEWPLQCSWIWQLLGEWWLTWATSLLRTMLLI